MITIILVFIYFLQEYDKYIIESKFEEREYKLYVKNSKE